MSIDIKALIYSRVGKIIISIILGLGLATLFRKVCNNRNCLKFTGPPLNKVENTKYSYDNKCYKFSTQAVKCDKDKKQVRFA